MHLFDALSPLSFLDRAARFHSGRTAVIDGDLRLTYAELHERCRRLAGSLSELAAGAPVAVLAPNTHVALEAHFAVPWSGSPLVMINTRLAAPEVRAILEHSGASVLLTDPSLLDLARSATQPMADAPFTVASGPGDDGTYEQMVTQGEPGISAPTDEHALLSINYTSGTTGEPKGAMYHHRGAYLQALAMVAHMRMDPSSVIPVDPADVPLQRLVFSVGRDGGSRNPCLPAQGRPRGHLGPGRQRGDHAHVRGTCGADQHARITCCTDQTPRPTPAVPHRRRGTESVDARGCRGRGCRGHPGLRAHRDTRSSRAMCSRSCLAGAGQTRAGPDAGPAGHTHLCGSARSCRCCRRCGCTRRWRIDG